MVGIYFGLRINFGFFTPYNSFKAKQDIENGQIQIISIGLPYMPEIEQKVANKYGFQYKYLGCNVTTELVNGTKYYNNVIESHLEKKYGINFWKKFNSEVDTLIKLKKLNG